MTRLRRLLGPALAALALLAVLLALGTWQLERLAWKTRLLHQIEAAEAAPPVPAGADPAPFSKISVAGALRLEPRALYGVEVRDRQGRPVLGGRLIQVLDRDHGAPVLVDRGWVPFDASETVASPTGRVEIVGYMRPADPGGAFTSAPDLARRRFYTLDPAAIGAALGAPEAANYTLVQLGKLPAGGLPEPAAHLPRPHNDHLSYALTWYGLALVLVVIFVLSSRKVLRA